MGTVARLHRLTYQQKLNKCVDSEILYTSKKTSKILKLKWVDSDILKDFFMLDPWFFLMLEPFN